MFLVEKVTKKRNGDFNLYLNGFEPYPLHVEKNIYLLNYYKTGDEIENNKEFQKFLKENQKALCLNQAVRFLAYSAKSSVEIRRKLKLKSYEKWAIDYAVKKLTESGIFDDGKMAFEMAEDLSWRKKLSKRAIQQKLFSKGLDNDDIKEAISKISNETELENAIYHGEKKYNSLDEEDPRKVKQKLMTYLGSKGFSYEHISKAVREIMD